MRWAKINLCGARDMCFSMKMMCAAGLGTWLLPVSSVTTSQIFCMKFQARFAVQEKKLVIFFHVVHFVLDFLTSGSADPDRKDQSLTVPVNRRPA